MYKWAPVNYHRNLWKYRGRGEGEGEGGGNLGWTCTSSRGTSNTSDCFMQQKWGRAQAGWATCKDLTFFLIILLTPMSDQDRILP